MSQSLMPEKNAFITEGNHALTKYGNEISPDNPTITKKVSFYVNTDGSLRYFIPVPYGWCDLWDGKPQYSSWYAQEVMMAEINLPQRCEMACEILQATNDGDDMDPST